MKQLSLDKKLYENLEKQAIFSKRIRSSIQELKYLRHCLEMAQPSWERISEKNWLMIGYAVRKLNFILEWEAYLLHVHEMQSDLPSKISLQDALRLTHPDPVQGGESKLSFLSGMWDRIAERVSLINRTKPYGKDTLRQEHQIRRNLAQSKKEMDEAFSRINKKLI